MIDDMLCNKIFNPVVANYLSEVELNISLVFIMQSYFAALKILG